MKLTKGILKSLIKEELEAEEFQVGDLVEYEEPFWENQAKSSMYPPWKFIGLVVNHPEEWDALVDATQVPVYIANYGIYGFGQEQLVHYKKQR